MNYGLTVLCSSCDKINDRLYMYWSQAFVMFSEVYEASSKGPRCQGGHVPQSRAFPALKAKRVTRSAVRAEDHLLVLASSYHRVDSKQKIL
jgi:hypothetical protein